MLVQYLRRLIGINAKGRAPLPNTRKQLLIGGLVCIALHPGILLTLMLLDPGQMSQGREIYLIINPWLVVTLLGIWLLLLAALSTERTINYKRTESRTTKKELK